MMMALYFPPMTAIAASTVQWNPSSSFFVIALLAFIKAASRFTRSVAEGKSAYAKELFTEDACLFGFLNGKFERGSIEQFYRNVDTVGAGKAFKTRIDVLELEETLAVVRVLEEGWGGTINFTDVLLLLKIDGQWKCVAKAYNQNSNTVTK